jgi:hypothetical protein
MRGCYLAVVLEPNKQLLALSKQLREQHGFLPMHLANPPRGRDVFHATIAFFRDGIDGEQLEKLRQKFEGLGVNLELTGHGKAVKGDDQALYFSLSPDKVEALRREIKDLGISFMATDPHITFGVHTETGKDAHGVPKLPQVQLEEMELAGTVHLKQGQSTLF